VTYGNRLGLIHSQTQAQTQPKPIIFFSHLASEEKNQPPMCWPLEKKKKKKKKTEKWVSWGRQNEGKKMVFGDSVRNSFAFFAVKGN